MLLGGLSGNQFQNMSCVNDVVVWWQKSRALKLCIVSDQNIELNQLINCLGDIPTPGITPRRGCPHLRRPVLAHGSFEEHVALHQGAPVCQS